MKWMLTLFESRLMLLVAVPSRLKRRRSDALMCFWTWSTQVWAMWFRKPLLLLRYDSIYCALRIFIDWWWQDIFRKYPHKYEGIISTLCENLDALDEPDAKASLAWIIGEYAERIDNADEMISMFVENFKEENAQVRLMWYYLSFISSLIFPSRCNCNSWRLQWNCFWRSLQRIKILCSVYSKLRQVNVTMRIFAIGRMCIGDCCQPTLKLQRFVYNVVTSLV